MIAYALIFHKESVGYFVSYRLGRRFKDEADEKNFENTGVDILREESGDLNLLNQQIVEWMFAHSVNRIAGFFGARADGFSGEKLVGALRQSVNELADDLEREREEKVLLKAELAKAKRALKCAEWTLEYYEDRLKIFEGETFNGESCPHGNLPYFTFLFDPSGSS